MFCGSVIASLVKRSLKAGLNPISKILNKNLFLWVLKKMPSGMNE